MDKSLLVATADGLHELGEDQFSEFAGREVRSLARGDQGVWAIVDRHEVWHAGNDGAWRRRGKVEGLDAICLSPFAGGVLVGTSGAHLLVLREEGLERMASFDEDRVRKNWYTPWGGPPDVRSISSDPADTVYVNVHVGGILRSRDAGESWEPTIDIDTDVHQVLFDSGSGILLAATAEGLATSSNAGESWHFETSGFHAVYLRALAVDGETLLVSASTGPTTDQGAVYTATLDDPAPFEKCRSGLPEWFADNINTFCLAAAGGHAAIGTADGSVYLSADRGRSWARVFNELPRINSLVLL